MAHSRTRTATDRVSPKQGKAKPVSKAVGSRAKRAPVMAGFPDLSKLFAEMDTELADIHRRTERLLARQDG